MRLALACLTLAFAPGAPAQTPAAPVVVELFTSQACNTCPPAEALFRDFAQRPDLVSLEWHVDYWDTLHVGDAGRWKDPYSSPKWTARQRAYNQALAGKASVYTPQAVISGRTETSGFNADTIERRVREASAINTSVTIRAAKTSAGATFTTGKLPTDAEATLVTFRKDASTDIQGGENKGRRLNSAHLVTGVRTLGRGTSFTAAHLAEGEGCALLIHERNQGAILAAAYCPAA